MNAILKDGEATRLFDQYRDNEKVWTTLLERCRVAPGSKQFKSDRLVAVKLGFAYLCMNSSTNNIERMFSRLSLIETKQRARHMGLYQLRDALQLATALPHQLNLYLSPVHAKTVEWYKLRNLVCPQKLIDDARLQFVKLFGSMRQKGSPDNLGPVKLARISAADNSFRGSRRSSNKLAKHQFLKTSKPQRRQEWNKSADAFVQKMRETNNGPENTIFGNDVANPGKALGRTRIQKAMMIKLKKHAKRSQAAAANEEKRHGLARSIKPFRGGKKNCSNKILRLGQRAKAMVKAKAVSKAAEMKRQYANYSKAQHRVEKAYYDDAKVTAAPFMVAGKRSKTDAGVSSGSVNIIPPCAAHGPSLSKKVLPSPARSSSTHPAPLSGHK